jgi:multidrug resistance efflux pump
MKTNNFFTKVKSLKDTLLIFFKKITFSKVSFYFRNPGIFLGRYKKVLLIFLALFIIALLIFKNKGDSIDEMSKVNVERQNISKTVKASGQVTSIVDLRLSFKKSDLVEDVYVSVGDKVKKGQVLATLKNQNELGVLNQAKAFLQKTMEGVSSEEERVSEVLYENAKKDYEMTKKQQDILVENAKRTLYSEGLVAEPTGDFSYSISSPKVYGSYTGNTEGEYLIELYPSSGGYGFMVSGLGSGTGLVSVNNTASIGQGLSIQFPDAFTLTGNTKWKVRVPNKSSLSYTQNLNAYENSLALRTTTLSNMESILNQRKAELDLKKAPPRNADVLNAQGQLQTALGSYENTVIRSPADGLVTKVAIKPGELVNSLVPVIVVQDISKLYVEANINESDITNIKEGQSVSFSIDAFGKETLFNGLVTQVDLAPTITDGIVNYKLKASINDDNKNIKSGMNSNLIITTETRDNVLVIPKASTYKKNRSVFVKKLNNDKKGEIEELEIKTGMVGDGGLIEVLSSNLNESDVVLISKDN